MSSALWTAQNTEQREERGLTKAANTTHSNQLLIITPQPLFKKALHLHSLLLHIYVFKVHVTDSSACFKP